MITKKAAISIIVAAAVLLTVILIPGLMIASNSDSPTVTRLYSESLEGPWSTTSSSASRWVEKITRVNDQTTIYIQEITFMWEAPTGTLVFFTGIRGNTGDQGPRGEAAQVPSPF